MQFLKTLCDPCPDCMLTLSSQSVNIINYYNLDVRSTCQSALYQEALCIISALHLYLSR